MKSSRTILAFVNEKINEYTSALAAESNPILKEHLKLILAEYSAIKSFIISKKVTGVGKKWVDLGLPSGRLWAAENEAGYHQYDEAVNVFGDMLPSAKAWKELFDQCTREWDDDRKGLVLTGPNGNTLFLPAKGWHNKKTTAFCVGIGGYYWTSSPDSEYLDLARLVRFRSDDVNPMTYDYRQYGFSVRLAIEFK